MNILVVDDAAFVRMALRKLLEPDYVVFEADNGRNAIKQYELLHPDLVILDITMPEMDGLETLRELKTIDPKAKVSMCSAMGQQDKIVTAIQDGALDFIVKPFDEKRILKSIERYTRK